MKSFWLNAVIVPLSTRISFKSLSGVDIDADLIQYLFSDEFFENEQEAFDGIPVGIESKVAIEACFSQGDMSVGIRPGWEIKNVWAL
jgi:hypothetical protein